MGNEIQLKTSLVGGFNKKQVIDYIGSIKTDYADEQTETDIQKFKAQVKELTLILNDKKKKAEKLKKEIKTYEEVSAENTVATEELGGQIAAATNELDPLFKQLGSITDEIDRIGSNLSDLSTIFDGQMGIPGLQAFANKSVKEKAEKKASARAISNAEKASQDSVQPEIKEKKAAPINIPVKTLADIKSNMNNAMKNGIVTSNAVNSENISGSFNSQMTYDSLYNKVFNETELARKSEHVVEENKNSESVHINDTKDESPKADNSPKQQEISTAPANTMQETVAPERTPVKIKVPATHRVSARSKQKANDEKKFEIPVAEKEKSTNIIPNDDLNPESMLKVQMKAIEEEAEKIAQEESKSAEESKKAEIAEKLAQEMEENRKQIEEDLRQQLEKQQENDRIKALLAKSNADLTIAEKREKAEYELKEKIKSFRNTHNN